MPELRASPGLQAVTLTAFRMLVFALSLIPLVQLLFAATTQALGPDPGQEVTEALGKAAFQWLLITLTMTPLKRWTGWSGWIRVRRMLGLFCFFYATLHVLAFLQFIVGWQDLWVTFTRRPYIIAGLLSFCLLLALALTSTRAAIRAMGKRWKKLHQWVYVAAIAAWVHYLWQARSDISEMVVYGSLLLLLLSLRVWWWLSRKWSLKAQ